MTLLLLFHKSEKITRSDLLMDKFIEQIVVKRAEGADFLKMAAFFSGGIIVCIFLWYVAAMLHFIPILPLVIIFASFGVIWLSWQLIQTTFIEYEYIIVNNELDIDKIIAKKNRKRLITIKLDKVTEWGAYTEGKNIEAEVTVKSHDCRYKNLWYLIAQHDKHGKTAVYFSPNRAVLELMNTVVPYSLRKKELKENEETVENQSENVATDENEKSRDI